MPNKQYSPCRLAQPSTNNHIARIHPNQNLVVYAQCNEIQIASDFIRLVETKKTKHKGQEWNEFVFSHVYDLTGWSRVSRAYLGDLIWSDNGKPMNISIVLESESHRDVVAVVNPLGSYLKFNPEDVIEIVVFYPKIINSEDTWSFTNISGDQGLIYEKVWHEAVNPESYQPNTAVGNWVVLPRSISDPCSEYHLWFKLNQQSKNLCRHIKDGVYSAGKFVFYNKAIDDIKFIFNPLLSVKNTKSSAKSSKIHVVQTVSGNAIAPYVPQHTHTQPYIPPQTQTYYTGKRTVWFQPQTRSVKIKDKKATGLLDSVKWMYLDDVKQPVQCYNNPYNIDDWRECYD